MNINIIELIHEIQPHTCVGAQSLKPKWNLVSKEIPTK